MIEPNSVTSADTKRKLLWRTILLAVATALLVEVAFGALVWAGIFPSGVGMAAEVVFRFHVAMVAIAMVGTVTIRSFVVPAGAWARSV